jgi:RNA polymerase sigma factor (TIGR02999 family)
MASGDPGKIPFREKGAEDKGSRISELPMNSLFLFKFLGHPQSFSASLTMENEGFLSNLPFLENPTGRAFLMVRKPRLPCYNGAMQDVTQILEQIETGDPSAADQLLPLVYEELRKLAVARLAQEKPGQTLQATALVHDVYLRLINVPQAQHWHGRGHFFAAAAEAMRRILIDRARSKGCIKRGGQMQRLDLANIKFAIDSPHEALLAIDESLERLTQENPTCAEVVKLRFFAGLTINETAAVLQISPSTVKRHWAFARAWLYEAIGNEETRAQKPLANCSFPDSRDIQS